MMSFRLFAAAPIEVPMASAWYLSDLAEGRAKQEVFARQSPQRLVALREHAIIESTVSSNRIEGVEISPERIKPVVLGNPAPRDRNEEELRGYRDALKLIHESHAKLPITEKTIRRLHALSRGDQWDAGEYKSKNVDIIETYPDGRSRIRFRSVAAKATRPAMVELVELWERTIDDRRIHPLVALGAFNLDFLCIHPFRDGNGRVSRLLLLLQCYHLGYEVGRYISLERLVEENKARYYETLERSSQGWHERKHDPWPVINFTLFALRSAYIEFQQRIDSTKAPRGEKTLLVLDAIERQIGDFSLTQIERACPGVSRDMIRRVLRTLANEGKVRCLGRGPGSKWQKKGTVSKRG